MKRQTRGSRWKRLWDWLRPVLVVVVVGSSLRSAVADWNDVPTGSMKPTILDGDRVFVNKLAYDLRVPFTSWRIASWADPQRGDVVICYSPADGTRLVKRVVGLPGDRIEMRNNQLIVNGTPLQYGPLDQDTIGQIEASDRGRRVFAEEKLGNAPHAVMATPEIPARRSFDPIVVPASHYFVMGDNRDESLDSRFFGCVPRDKIVGEALRVILSLDYDRHCLPRTDRFLRRLP